MRTATYLIALVGCFVAAACQPAAGGNARDATTAVDASDAGPDASITPNDSGCSQTMSTGDAGTFDFPDVVTATTAPPPLSGGTLLVTRDQHWAVVSDPDRDVVQVVDLDVRQLHGSIPLALGDEPNRLVEDAAGQVHVLLRRGGAIVAISPASATLLRRDPVCASPRGIAYDSAANVLYVACQDGEFITLDPASGTIASTAHLDVDLRDVVVTDGNVFVGTFRSAEVLHVSGGAVIGRQQLTTMMRTESISMGDARSVPFVPHVVWRMVSTPSGGAIALHQREEAAPLAPASISAGTTYYGPHFLDDCATGVVHSAVTLIDATGQPASGTVFAELELPIDIAVSNDGVDAVVVPAGGASGDPATVRVATLAVLQATPCESTSDGSRVGVDVPLGSSGRAVAAAWIGPGHDRLAVQLREPASLALVSASAGLAPQNVMLATDSRADSGFDLFHTATGGQVACAGCHPEANDDGHVWQFPCDGARRTQTLRGGLLATAPFHWDGTLGTFQAVTADAFTQRLGIAQPAADLSSALGHWLDQQTVLPYATPIDPQSVARGAELFREPSVGCVGCHSGEHFTNNQTVDVGTGGAFQVPSLLGVAGRSPYLHNGCALTLADRFGPCGGGDRHGSTSQLTAAQVSDLVDYMETL